jgi:S-adenosylmethionine hydrolase
MAIVTLTTDWQNQDYYAAIVKAGLLSSFPDLQIVDISHSIPHFNILNASFVVANVFSRFPENTIHLICVDSEKKKNTGHVLVKSCNQYFISADNGILTLILYDKNKEIYELKNSRESIFPAIEIFVPAAIHILQKKDIKEIALRKEELYTMYPYLANYSENTIEGQVIYIDSYGNIISNIDIALFEQVRKSRNFTIYPGTNYYKIKELSKSYNSVDPGEMTAFFNSANLLEIAINKGKLAELINISIQQTIRIIFS